MVRSVYKVLKDLAEEINFFVFVKLVGGIDLYDFNEESFSFPFSLMEVIPDLWNSRAMMDFSAVVDHKDNPFSVNIVLSTRVK